MILAALTLSLALSGQQADRLKQVMLDPAKTNQKIPVAGGLGVATTIVLPDDWIGVPICGDCAFGTDDSGGALWRILLQKETRTLVVKPIQAPSASLPPSEFLTNIQLSLASGLVLTFFVALVPKAEADFSITLSLPKDATSSSKLSRLEKQLEASFETKVAERANEKLLENLLHPVTCKDIGNKVSRDDGMVVRLKQLCHSGSFLYVTFEVENRKRLPLELGAASLTDPDDNVSGETRFAKRLLGFNERSMGVTAFTNLDPETPHRTYSVLVQEEGGQGRSVEWSGLQFGGWF